MSSSADNVASRLLPLGDPVNDSPHSVCVHLPTLRDVEGYEERDPRVMDALKSGYPRFTRHAAVARLTERVAREQALEGRTLFLVSSEHRARELIHFAGTGKLLRDSDFHGVHISSGETGGLDRARLFIQHTGCGLTSREASAALGLPPHPEQVEEDDPGGKVREHLRAVYDAASPADIFLGRGGMNAFYAAFKVLRDEQAAMGRVHWIQLGWLYLDTACILEKMLPVGGQLFRHYDVADLDGLAQLLRTHSTAIAGIVTEVPTNPLVETCDIEALQALARRHGVALILDPTIASPHNVNILSYSDAHINSLTKYAGNRGDVMVGAVALNRESPFYRVLRDRLPQEIDAPPQPDLARLAWEMRDYAATVEATNANALAVAAFLDAHPKVDGLWWALRPRTRANYEAILRPGGGPGAILTFTVKGSLRQFYDAVPLVKSPSFGAHFTMLCPFLYLAHYDLVRNEAGRRLLSRIGLPPYLIRLSVGIEPTADIIDALSQGLDAVGA